MDDRPGARPALVQAVLRSPARLREGGPDVVEDEPAARLTASGGGHTSGMGTTRGAVLRQAAGRGALAGLAGVAAMTAGEKAEQAVTGRPDSYVPARALLTLLGRHPADTDRPLLWNWAMHYGTGALLGALRGVWAAVGLRGARAHLAHAVTRLSVDQTVENTTGVGAPPRTWPAREEAVDVLHKSVYALVTGVLAERWVPPALEPARGRLSR